MKKDQSIGEFLKQDKCKLLPLPVVFLSQDNEMSQGRSIKRVIKSSIHKTEVYLITRPFKPLYKVK